MRAAQATAASRVGSSSTAKPPLSGGAHGYPPSVTPPLAETREHYLVQVRQSGAVLREVQVFSPGWTYTAAQQATDGASGPVAITVAQVSESFGPGPARRLEVTL